MATNRPSRATFADLLELPPDVRAEIVHGVIVDKASPTMEHGMVQRALGGVIGRWFGGQGGGRRPGGWWIATEVDVEYESHELFRHDLVGWRRDRVPERPAGRPVRIRPDWVCEILSPSNEKRDRVDKFRVLQQATVPYYWIANADERILAVHRLEAGGYLVALTATTGETVRAAPFDVVELRVNVLFGDEDDD